MTDKLAQEVPSPEAFFLGTLTQLAQARTQGNVEALLGFDQKSTAMLQQLAQYYTS